MKGSGPHLTHDSLDPCEPITQTACRSFEPILHRWPQRVPILYNGTPLPPQNCSFPWACPFPWGSGSRVSPIGWLQIWWPIVFGLLFRLANFSTTDISHIFVEAQRNLASLGGWPIKTHFQNLVNFGPGSHDTMRRYASILHWCTCKVVLRQFYNVCQ